MNISYHWLNEVIDIDLAPELLADELTRVGLAVEGVHPHGDDYVLDIDLTSNRPDCLSHLGVAREVSVITGNKVKVERPTSDESEVPFPAVLAPEVVKIEDAELCHRFTARIIRNVKIGPSPEWLVKRLEAVGERSINNIADITNYVMFELGQPMHAFDLDKLAENRIVVRRARSGEAVQTLDEVVRKLDESILAICDAEKPAAIGGVMGGLDSAIGGDTVNVLLEVAYFKRESIRETSRKLNLTTEASYRFERGVDINNVQNASDRAARLIVELAGGELGDFIDVYPTKHGAIQVESQDISRAVNRLTGLLVDEPECIETLRALGISAQDGSVSVGRVFDVPSWRHDITIEEDLVEEVARHAGYEKIADELPPSFGAGEYQASEVRKKLLRQSLVDLGFDEAISYSFIDTKFDGVFETVPGIVDDRSDEKFVTLRDAVIEGAVRMRPTLLPGLLEAVRLNFNHQRRDVRLLEIGRVFTSKTGEEGLPLERELFALVITGGDLDQDRAMPTREVDFYDAKGALEAALSAVGIENSEFSAGEFRHLQKGQTAAISLHGFPIGSLGRLNSEISANYKFKQPVYVAEIDLQTVLAAEAEPILYAPLPKYPSVVRDVSFLVKRSDEFEKIRTAAVQQGHELCRRIEFVDIYEGKGVGEDERSLTLRMEYRSDERTLIENEVDSVHNDLVETLERSLGIRRRF
jgi:phenylalanyl-tRNA synthetase beta chain